MKFEHQFQVKAPLDRVVEFHRHPNALAALTPPIAFVRFHDKPSYMQQGDSLTFTLWIGPIPVRWESIFPEVSDSGFVDIQGDGPFQTWQHRHHFVPTAENTTTIHDRIEATLPRAPVRAVVAALMWAALPLLFWYRKRQTRRLLQHV